MPETTTYVLIQGRKGSAERMVELRGASARVGRGADCEIRLREALIADVQLMLRRRGDKWHVQPIGPPGRVWIDGKPLESQNVLPLGAPIRIGSHLLTLRSPDLDAQAIGGFAAPIVIESSASPSVVFEHSFDDDVSASFGMGAGATAMAAATVSKAMIAAGATSSSNSRSAVGVATSPPSSSASASAKRAKLDRISERLSPSDWRARWKPVVESVRERTSSSSEPTSAAESGDADARDDFKSRTEPVAELNAAPDLSPPTESAEPVVATKADEADAAQPVRDPKPSSSPTATRPRVAPMPTLDRPALSYPKTGFGDRLKPEPPAASAAAFEPRVPKAPSLQPPRRPALSSLEPPFGPRDRDRERDAKPTAWRTGDRPSPFKPAARLAPASPPSPTIPSVPAATPQPSLTVRAVPVDRSQAPKAPVLPSDSPATPIVSPLDRETPTSSEIKPKDIELGVPIAGDDVVDQPSPAAPLSLFDCDPDATSELAATAAQVSGDAVAEAQVEILPEAKAEDSASQDDESVASGLALDAVSAVLSDYQSVMPVDEEARSFDLDSREDEPGVESNEKPVSATEPEASVPDTPVAADENVDPASDSSLDAAADVLAATEPKAEIEIESEVEAEPAIAPEAEASPDASSLSSDSTPEPVISAPRSPDSAPAPASSRSGRAAVAPPRAPALPRAETRAGWSESARRVAAAPVPAEAKSNFKTDYKPQPKAKTRTQPFSAPPTDSSPAPPLHEAVPESEVGAEPVVVAKPTFDSEASPSAEARPSSFDPAPKPEPTSESAAAIGTTTKILIPDPPIPTRTKSKPPAQARVRDSEAVKRSGAGVDPDWKLPSAQAILEACRTPTPQAALPAPSKPSRRQGRRFVAPTLTIRQAPHSYAMPMATSASLVAACGTAAVGLILWALSAVWAWDNRQAGLIANDLLRGGGPANANQVHLTLQDAGSPRRTWWSGTAGHLYLNAYGLNRSGRASAREVDELLGASRMASPAHAETRLAIASLKSPATQEDLFRSLGQSRDPIALAWTGRTLLAAGKSREALQSYREALLSASRKSLSRGGPLRFDESPAVRRYRLPGELELAAILEDMAKQSQWTFDDWKRALPRYSLAWLAAYKVLSERTAPRAQRDQALEQAIVEAAEAPAEGCSKAVHLAAAAEAEAIGARWEQAEALYLQAVKRVTEDAVRRSWWMNLADIYARLRDEDKRLRALVQARGANMKDEIALRAAQAQVQSGPKRSPSSTAIGSVDPNVRGASLSAETTANPSVSARGTSSDSTGGGSQEGRP